MRAERESEMAPSGRTPPPYWKSARTQAETPLSVPRPRTEAVLLYYKARMSLSLRPTGRDEQSRSRLSQPKRAATGPVAPLKPIWTVSIYSGAAGCFLTTTCR